MNAATNIVRLTAMMAKPSGSSRAIIVLPLVAFSVTTSMLLLVLGGTRMFFRLTTTDAATFQSSAIIALALLAVPLVTLASSTVRLSARRRNDRLATLRLLGATPGTVAAMTVLESTLLAVTGAGIGVVLNAAVVPIVGLVHFHGAPIGAAALWVGPSTTIAVIALTAILAAASAIASLRKVVISPLGVRINRDAPRFHWSRVAIGAVVLVGGLIVMNAVDKKGELTVAILAGLVMGATLGVMSLVGPLVLRRIAASQVKKASTPQRLLAARSILDDPRAAWRQVAGVAMTSFIAVFAGVGTAITGLDPHDPGNFATDLQTGILLTLAISFITVACSVGVNQSSEILERRDISVSLDRLGVPRPVMERARSRAVLVPVIVAAIGSASVAGLLILPLTGWALLTAPTSLLMIALTLAAGIGVVALGLLATRPVANSALAIGRNEI